VVIVIGAIVIGPVFAGRSVRLLGAGLPRLKGVTGRLATENAARAPKRTAATTSALIIGVALIGFITVFAASAKDSVASEVERGLKADLIVQADAGFGPPSGFTPDVGRRIAKRPDVTSVSAIGFGEAELTYPDGDTAHSFLTSIEPSTVTDALTPRMERGQITDLTDGGVIVDRQIVKDNDLEIGDRIGVTVPGGKRLDLIVQAISDDATILGFWTLTQNDYTSVVPEQLDVQVYVDVEDDAEIATVQQEIDEMITDVPSMEVLDRDGFVGDLASQITGVLNFIYGLLGLSIIIAMIGIANTLSLSVHERTREIGLLRAVGMTRPQVRSTVRWEAVIIAVLGTLVGLALGLILSRGLIEALEGYGLKVFTVPFGSMVVVVLVAAALAVMASIRPARRAARLDVLQAIATE
jgi:putative ABC transport system permease protein